MDLIKQIATVIFVSLILYGIVAMLLPEKSKGNIKNIIGIAVIATVILSVRNIDLGEFQSEFEFNIPVANTDVMTEMVLKTEQSAVETAVEGVIKERLGAENINFTSVSTFTDISETGGISIIKAEVVLNDENIEKAKAAVGDLGFRIEYFERTSE
jgi:hypothetical protein